MSDNRYDDFGGLPAAMRAFVKFPMDPRMRRMLLDGADQLDALAARVAELERAAEAGVNLWHYLCENDIAWSEDQDFFVELGLLERVDVPADIAEEDRCRNCCGECDHCYRPTGLLKWEPDAPADGPEHG